MNALPLHPALVHLPLGLAFVMPLVSLGLAWALFTERVPRRTWTIVVALQTVLLAGGLLALRTGEAEEGRVERIVAEAVIAQHEAAARQFVWATAGTLALAVGALLVQKGATSRVALALAVAGSFVVTGLAVRVGHAGGQLVYVHGAASAYAPQAAAEQVGSDPNAPAPRAPREADER